MRLLVEKSLSKVGSRYITDDIEMVEAASPLRVSDCIDGESNVDRVSREFSYSYDRKDYSIWTTLTDLNLAAIDYSKTVYVKLKLEVTEKYTSNPLVIRYIDVNWDMPQVEEYNPRALLDAFDTTVSDDFYLIGDAMIPLQNDVNKWINTNRGPTVLYWSHRPDMDSIDPVLQEYGVLMPSARKEIKVIIPNNNEVPEPKENEIDTFGVNYDLEVHIDKVYFESIFGRDVKPRNEDYLLIRKLNRLYYVFSNYLDRGINSSSTYYVLGLKKFDDNSLVVKEDETAEFISEKFGTDGFLDLLESEMKDLTNDQQNSVKTMSDDSVRELLEVGTVITPGDLRNNSHLICHNYYDLTGLEDGKTFVRYAPEISTGAAWSMSSWFQQVKGKAALQFDITSQSKLPNGLLSTTISTTLARCGLVPGSAIIRGSAVLYVEDVSGENVVVLRSKDEININEVVGWKKSAMTNLLTAFDGENTMSVNVHDCSVVGLEYNGYKVLFTGLRASPGKWYGLVLNISNGHKYIGVYLWEAGADVMANVLSLKYKKEIVNNNRVIVLPCKPEIHASAAYLANIRYYNRCIAREYQSALLVNQRLKTPSMAFVIDDCQMVFNVKNLGKGITKNK